MYSIPHKQKFFQENTLKISYGGCEGTGVTGSKHLEWPIDKANEELGGVPLWRSKITSNERKALAGYYVMDVCLYVHGPKLPEVLPLNPQMKGHDVSIFLYEDIYGNIKMRAIGGFSI